MRARPTILPIGLCLALLPGVSPCQAGRPRFAVSLVELIANPRPHEGRRVELEGFLHLEFEGDAIYLHREDCQFGIHKNAVWVQIPEVLLPLAQKYNDRYVALVGVYTARRNGHCGLFSGELTRIERIDLLESRGLIGQH